MARMTPKEAMSRAILEAKNGAGFVSPNPLVGCTILDRDMNLLSVGYHAKVGEAHAEIRAVQAVDDQSKLQGAHVFVTLEPCAHEGRTPSCAKALAALPIASVTYGLEDPNPKVAGEGANILKSAGKKVEKFSEGLDGELEDLCEIFLMNMRQHRPFVGLKVASSLDGQIALKSGESQWITGSVAREHVHYLRGSYDAVLTGARTVLRDNPQLNSRLERFQNNRQRLVVLDLDGVLAQHLPSLAVFKARSPGDLVMVTKPGVKVDSQVVHLEMPVKDQVFDLKALVDELFKINIFSILIESGAFTASSFLNANLVDRLYLFLAPKILGAGLGWTSGLNIPSLDQAIVLRRMQLQSFGEDVLLSARMGQV